MANLYPSSLKIPYKQEKKIENKELLLLIAQHCDIDLLFQQVLHIGIKTLM